MGRGSSNILYGPAVRVNREKKTPGETQADLGEIVVAYNADYNSEALIDLADTLANVRHYARARKVDFELILSSLGFSFKWVETAAKIKERNYLLPVPRQTWGNKEQEPALRRILQVEKALAAVDKKQAKEAGKNGDYGHYVKPANHEEATGDLLLYLHRFAQRYEVDWPTALDKSAGYFEGDLEDDPDDNG